mmetsp:Transcript_55668/g.129628  ORF Transcript_55668/g.129628 Transcript_55668/m.129628 type:complete len:292 (-) Transcript_55668:3-878(-)
MGVMRQPGKDQGDSELRELLRQPPEQQYGLPPATQQRHGHLETPIEDARIVVFPPTYEGKGGRPVFLEVRCSLPLGSLDKDLLRGRKRQDEVRKHELGQSSQFLCERTPQGQVRIFGVVVSELVMLHVAHPVRAVTNAQRQAADAGNNVLHKRVQAGGCTALRTSCQVVVHTLMEGCVQVMDPDGKDRHSFKVAQATSKSQAQRQSHHPADNCPVAEDVPAEGECLVLDHRLTLHPEKLSLHIVGCCCLLHWGSPLHIPVAWVKVRQRGCRRPVLHHRLHCAPHTHTYIPA